MIKLKQHLPSQAPSVAPEIYSLLENIEFKELTFDDVNKHFLDNFNRYQEVDRYWHNENGNWSLVDGGYIVDWDKNKMENFEKTQLLQTDSTNADEIIFSIRRQDVQAEAVSKLGRLLTNAEIAEISNCFEWGIGESIEIIYNTFFTEVVNCGK